MAFLIVLWLVSSVGAQYSTPDQVEIFPISEPIYFNNYSDTKMIFEVEGEIPKDAFKKLNLTKLSIHGNVSYIQPGAFEGLGNLTKLDLNNNRIRYLLDFTFRGLSALEDLYLSGNRINFIEQQAFSALHRLKILNLSHNPEIKTLLANRFQDLNSIITLDISNCGLMTIEIGAFQGLNSLKELNLSRNRLKSIYGNVFRGADKITGLNLGYNEFDWLDYKDITRSLPELSEIDISSEVMKCRTAELLRRNFRVNVNFGEGGNACVD